MSFEGHSFDLNAFSTDAFDLAECNINPLLMCTMYRSDMINVIKKKL